MSDVIGIRHKKKQQVLCRMSSRSDTTIINKFSSGSHTKRSNKSCFKSGSHTKRSNKSCFKSEHAVCTSEQLYTLFALLGGYLFPVPKFSLIDRPHARWRYHGFCFQWSAAIDGFNQNFERVFTRLPSDRKWGATRNERAVQCCFLRLQAEPAKPAVRNFMHTHTG